jgi:type II secretory pathway component PulC
LARKLLRNLNVLNLLLLAATLGFAFNRLLPLIDSPVAYTPPGVKSTVPKTPEEAPAPAPSTNPLDYTVIAEQNLFHPERKIPPEKKAEAPLPKPEFVLYGTLVTSDLGVAYLEDKKAPPVTTAGRGKRQTALKKGESLSGFILKEIQADRVTLTRG